MLTGGLACVEGDDGNVDSSSSSSPDSGTKTGQDSGEPVETGEVPVEGTQLEIVLDADVVADGGILSAHWVDYESWEKGGVSVGEAFLEASAAAATTTITMPDPLPEHLSTPSDEGGRSIAVYVVAVRTEDPIGEVWRGVSENLLLWSTEAVPEDDILEGWNFFNPKDSEILAAGPLSLGSNLNPIDVLSFGGSLDSKAAATELRGTLIPLNKNSTATKKIAVWDETLGSEWSVDLTERPPANHFYFVDGMGIDCAGELPAAYVDVDGDKSYDETFDVFSYSTCIDEDVVAAYYWDVVRDVEVAVQFMLAEWRPGWVLVRTEVESDILVSEDDLSRLYMGSKCVPKNTDPS